MGGPRALPRHHVQAGLALAETVIPVLPFEEEVTPSFEGFDLMMRGSAITGVGEQTLCPANYHGKNAYPCFQDVPVQMDSKPKAFP